MISYRTCLWLICKSSFTLWSLNVYQFNSYHLNLHLIVNKLLLNLDNFLNYIIKSFDTESSTSFIMPQLPDSVFCTQQKMNVQWLTDYKLATLYYFSFLMSWSFHILIIFNKLKVLQLHMLAKVFKYYTNFCIMN